MSRLSLPISLSLFLRECQSSQGRVEARFERHGRSRNSPPQPEASSALVTIPEPLRSTNGKCKTRARRMSGFVGPPTGALTASPRSPGVSRIPAIDLYRSKVVKGLIEEDLT